MSTSSSPQSPQRSAFLRLLAALPLTAAAPSWSSPLAQASQPELLSTTAQLLAGLEPDTMADAYQHVMQQRAWRQHRKANLAGHTKLRERLEALSSWSTANLGTEPVGGRTLVYPFSGPDFINAFALFPAYDNYVFFSLEEPGRVPQLDKMSPGQMDRLFKDLRVALNDLVHLNFFITPNMNDQVRSSSLSGVTPLLMAMMALLGLRIERVEALDLWPERTAAIASRTVPRPTQRMQAIQIDFQRPGSRLTQTLWYFSLDASDSALRHYPEFMNWLRNFADPVVLLKSASYLLHGENFKQVRSFVLDRAVQIVQDDTGVPYRLLSGGGWKVSLYGRYEQPIQLFRHRYQNDLATAFEQVGAQGAAERAVPFPFGYNWRQQGNSFVILARRERLTS